MMTTYIWIGVLLYLIGCFVFMQIICYFDRKSHDEFRVSMLFLNTVLSLTSWLGVIVTAYSVFTTKRKEK